MSSNLPVPSKAALAALRGIVLGTSCTIALITEDRRRRINNAIDVIETSKKLKSCRKYHGGGTQFALALEEEAEVLPFPFEPTARVVASTSRGAKARPRTEFPSRSAEISRICVAEAAVAAPLRTNNEEWARPSSLDATSPSGRPRPFIRPAELPSSPACSFQRTVIPENPAPRFPSNDRLISMMHEASNNRDEDAMHKTLQLVLTAYDGKLAPDNRHELWVQATGLLCRTLQEMGKIDDAAILLQMVVAQGSLLEADYFKHNPLMLIDGFLSEKVPKGLEERKSYISKLDLAVTLFLPTFTKKPSSTNEAVIDTGRRLMKRAFSIERLKRIEEIYWRCLSYEGNNGWQLAELFVTHLHESHNYQLAIRHFLLSYSKMKPPTESIQNIGNAVVQAVESAHNYKVAQVLKAMLSLCSGTCQLRTQWVMKLFTCHWQKHKNYAETLDLFNELMASGLKSLVPHSDCLYRIMIEIALEAGEEAEATSFFNHLISQDQELSSDVRILGRFALFKAKRGDWAGVQADFEAMRVNGARAREHCSNVLVPILKVFANQHTVAETDQFLRLYIDDLKVPISRYVVALLANKYGSQRDLLSFLRWLEYCVTAGFKVDSAFASSILVNCKRRWGFSFADLRRVFRNLKTLSPNCMDKANEHFMVNAAIEDGAGPAARGRVVSLGVDPIKLARRGKCASTREVTLAMKEALTCGNPARSVKVYKRALHLGMPFSPHALRLAVQASLAVNEDNSKPAFALLQDARAGGNDISEAIVCVIAAQLKKLRRQPHRSAAPGFLAEVRATIEQFESQGIVLGENVLHKAAALCLHARHYQAAILYATRAAKASGKPGPGCNLTSFKLLVMAHAQLVDVDGLQWVVTQALSSNYKENTACIQHLKLARAILRGKAAQGSSKTAQISGGIDMLDDAIAQIKGFRGELAVERENLEDEVMKIMKQAALNADATLALDRMAWIERPPRLRHEHAENEDRGVKVFPELPNKGATQPLDSGMEDYQSNEYLKGGLGASSWWEPGPLRPEIDKHCLEVRVRPKKNLQDSPPYVGRLSDDPLTISLEKACWEERASNRKKQIGTVRW